MHYYCTTDLCQLICGWFDIELNIKNLNGNIIIEKTFLLNHIGHHCQIIDEAPLHAVIQQKKKTATTQSWTGSGNDENDSERLVLRL